MKKMVITDKFLTVEDFLALPVGTIVVHSYGRSFVSETVKDNAESFLSDVGRVRFFAAKESYAFNALITDVDDLPNFGEVVGYVEGGPDWILNVGVLRSKYKGSNFTGRMLTV